MKKSWTRILIVFLTMSLVVSMLGCQSIIKRILPESSGSEEKSSNNQKGSEESAKKEEPPKSLTEMDGLIEKVITEIEKVQQKKDEAKMKTENNQSNSQTGEEKKQKDPEGEKKNEQTVGKQEAKKTEVDWVKINKTLREIHEQWNAYEGQAIKDGAPPEILAKFEEAVTHLSNTIFTKDEMKTLVAANESYQYIPEFLNLYKHNKPPETKKMKFYIQQILFDSKMNKWDLSEMHLMGLNEAWTITQSKMKKGNTQINQRISNAIRDFEDAVKARNSQLTEIKAEILLKNIEAIK
ncbi:MAG: hypothetical protein ACOX6S_09620 [Clostridia bacterium]|jgi:uncharacterized protein YceK